MTFKLSGSHVPGPRMARVSLVIPPEPGQEPGRPRQQPPTPKHRGPDDSPQPEVEVPLKSWEVKCKEQTPVTTVLFDGEGVAVLDNHIDSKVECPKLYSYKFDFDDGTTLLTPLQVMAKIGARRTQRKNQDTEGSPKFKSEGTRSSPVAVHEMPTGLFPPSFPMPAASATSDDELRTLRTRVDELEAKDKNNKELITWLLSRVEALERGPVNNTGMADIAAPLASLTLNPVQLLAREPSDEYIALDDILYNLKEDDIEAEDFWDTLVGGRGPVHRAPGAEEDRVATTLREPCARHRT